MINSTAVGTEEIEQIEIAAAPSSVTVIVPIRNEAAFIARTLEQLLDQDLTGIELEILVLDGQSTDSTRDVVAAFVNRDPRVRLLSNPRRLSSAARNLAIQNSAGEYVVVIDGHCEIPSRRYFLDLVNAFQESGADCLGRPQPLDVSHATPLQKAIAVARSSRLGHHPESFIYSDEPQYVPAKSVAVAYRREVFDKVGLFDEAFDAHEDGEFNLRCDREGLRCYLDPKLTVKYHPRTSLSGLFKQMMRYGRGRVRLALKHDGLWGLGTLIPLLFVLFVLLGAIAVAVLPSARLPYFVLLAVYSLVLLAEGTIVAWKQDNVGMIWRVPLTLTTVHAGAGVGTLAELIGLREQ